MPIDRHDAERLDERDPLAQWRHEFVIPDPAAAARQLKALKALRGSAPDFPDHTR